MTAPGTSLVSTKALADRVSAPPETSSSRPSVVLSEPGSVRTYTTPTASQLPASTPTLVPAAPSRLRKLSTLATPWRGTAKARITAPISVRSPAGIHPRCSPASTRVAELSAMRLSAMAEPTGRRATVAGMRASSGEGAIRDGYPLAFTLRQPRDRVRGGRSAL